MNLKKEIQTAEHCLSVAISSQNSRSVSDLYTDDASFLPDGAPTVSGRENITIFFEQLFAAGVIAGEFVTLDVEGDDSHAIEIGAFTLFAQSPNRERIVAGKGRYLVYWKRIEGVWKLHRDVVSRDQLSS